MDMKSAFLYERIEEEVYVDDIIFGSTKKELCNEFERLMKDKYQMSFMGELTFFLGLQVNQKVDGIFISQDKYVTEVLRKFNLLNVKTVSTPVDTEKPLVKDADGGDIDVHIYISMIGSFMYLTKSRPNIIHIKYALTENPTIYASLIQQSWQITAANTIDTEEVQITAIIDGKVKLITKASIKRHLKLEDSDSISTLPNTEIFKQLALIGSNSLKNFDHNSSPTHTHVANKAASTGVDVRHGGAATTVTSLDIGQGIDRVLALETDLQQTKKVYSTAFTKLIMKVKKLKKTIKSTKARRRAKIVKSDDKDDADDSSKQRRKIDAINQDLDIFLVEHDVERIARVHKETSSFNVDEWEDIQATIEADEELALRIQAEEREKVNTFTPMESDVDRTIPKIEDESSKRATEEELEQTSSKRQKTRESSEPKEKEDDELTQKDLQQMIMIVPVEKFMLKPYRSNIRS
nr:uncharacterized mitochondrial protein AtMg00810-like [Tanacetum cinerariifolium]